MRASPNYRVKSRPIGVLSVATAVALSLVAFSAPAASAAPVARTPLPKACPSKSMLESALKDKITKVASATTTSSHGTVKVCAYKTSFKVHTEIAFGTPVSQTGFVAVRKAEAKKASIVVVHGVGDAAWALKGGAGFSFLKGTLDTGIAAPHATDAQLVTLARSIIKGLPQT
jgi:hypothetical protein